MPERGQEVVMHELPYALPVASQRIEASLVHVPVLYSHTSSKSKFNNKVALYSLFVKV